MLFDPVFFEAVGLAKIIKTRGNQDRGRWRGSQGLRGDVEEEPRQQGITGDSEELPLTAEDSQFKKISKYDFGCQKIATASPCCVKCDPPEISSLRDAVWSYPTG